MGKTGKYSLPEELRTKDKLTEEDAVAQFMKFIIYYEVDLDEAAEETNKRRAAQAEQAGNTNFKPGTADEIGDDFVKMIRRGYISIDDSEGTAIVIHHIQKPWLDNSVKEIKYKDIRGKDKQSMNDATCSEVGKLLVLAASIMEFSGKMSAIKKMHPIDFEITQGIALLFLTV